MDEGGQSIAWRLAGRIGDQLVSKVLPAAKQCASNVANSSMANILLGSASSSKRSSHHEQLSDSSDTATNDNRQTGGTRTDSLSTIIAPLEGYIISIQSILLWDRPYHSAVALIAINCFYWLLISWTRRFYSVLFYASFFFTLYRLWTNHIWPEIRVPIPEDQLSNEDWTPVHPTALSAPEIVVYMNQCVDMVNVAFNWFLNLRKNNHGFFCVLVTSIFILSAFLGRAIPGVVVVYILLMTLALGPGMGLYVLPSGWFGSLRRLATGTSVEANSDNDRLELEEDDVSERTVQENVTLSQRLNAELMLEVVADKTSLDSELGITREPSDHSSTPALAGQGEQVDMDCDRGSRASSEESTGSGGMKFIACYFSRKSSEDGSEETKDIAVTDEDTDLTDEFEILTEAEIKGAEKDESAAGSQELKSISFLETNL